MAGMTCLCAVAYREKKNKIKGITSQLANKKFVTVEILVGTVSRPLLDWKGSTSTWAFVKSYFCIDH